MMLTDEEIWEQANRYKTSSGCSQVVFENAQLLAFARRIAKIQMEKDAEICYATPVFANNPEHHPATAMRVQEMLHAAICAQKGE